MDARIDHASVPNMAPPTAAGRPPAAAAHTAVPASLTRDALGHQAPLGAQSLATALSPGAAQAGLAPTMTNPGVPANPATAIASVVERSLQMLAPDRAANLAQLATPLVSNALVQASRTPIPADPLGGELARFARTAVNADTSATQALATAGLVAMVEHHGDAAVLNAVAQLPQPPPQAVAVGGLIVPAFVMTNESSAHGTGSEEHGGGGGGSYTGPRRLRPVDGEPNALEGDRSDQGSAFHDLLRDPRAGYAPEAAIVRAAESQTGRQFRRARTFERDVADDTGLEYSIVHARSVTGALEVAGFFAGALIIAVTTEADAAAVRASLHGRQVIAVVPSL